MKCINSHWHPAFWRTIVRLRCSLLLHQLHPLRLSYRSVIARISFDTARRYLYGEPVFPGRGFRAGRKGAFKCAISAFIGKEHVYIFTREQSDREWKVRNVPFISLGCRECALQPHIRDVYNFSLSWTPFFSSGSRLPRYCRGKYVKGEPCFSQILRPAHNSLPVFAQTQVGSRSRDTAKKRTPLITRTSTQVSISRN